MSLDHSPKIHPRARSEQSHLSFARFEQACYRHLVDLGHIAAGRRAAGYEPMRIRTRQRRWIVLWASLALVFAQLVVAAHACPQPSGPAQGAPSHHEMHPDAQQAPGHCPDTEHAQGSACQAHCADAGQSDQNAKPGSVPPASVAAVALAAPRVLRVPLAVVQAEFAEDARVNRPRVVLFGVRLI